MKNTKKLILTSLTLAIALFASVQVTAMERTINPHLTNKQKQYIEIQLNAIKKAQLLNCDPKKNIHKETCIKYGKMLAKFSTIYYDDKPYTQKTIDAAGNWSNY